VRSLVHVAVADGGERGGARADASLLQALHDAGRPLKGDEARRAFPGFGPFVEQAIPVGQQAAEAELAKLCTRARRALEAERDATLARLSLALAHQGLPPEAQAAQLADESAHYARLLEALAGARVVLDAACGFVLNR
jgi:ATP-dependent helicase HepA